MCLKLTEKEDNSSEIKKDLERFVYHLRLSAEVQVIEMVNTRFRNFIICNKSSSSYVTIVNTNLSSSSSSPSSSFIA